VRQLPSLDPEPAPEEMDLLAILQALADPVRLQIVLGIAPHDDGVYCKTFAQHLAKATRSYHLKVLREAGLTHTVRVGVNKVINLRRDELESRFPGVIDSIVAAGRETELGRTAIALVAR
jgi:DNA-binding transcriptional ArsR family regulator